MSTEPEPSRSEPRSVASRLDPQFDELAIETARRRRAESLLASEKEILELVASGARLEDALLRLATVVEEHASPGLRASILVLDEDRRRLRHGAGPTLPQFYVEAIDGLAIGPGVGSCGTAAHTGRRVVVSDVQKDSLWRGYRELAQRAGLRACWSTPILDDGRRVLGTFALYYGEPRTPTAEELDMVDNAAHVAGIAISRHRQGMERRKLLMEARAGRAIAEAANRSKDQFIAMLGHELRNPLAAMMNAAELLGVQNLKPDTRTQMHGILLRQGENLRRILDDLLEVTRIDAGKLRLMREVLRLDELMAACVADAEGTARAQSIRLECELEPVSIDADPTRVEQIIRNLVDNAIKYGADDGSVCISVRREHDKAVLVIEDDGIGIDPDLLTVVFEPFIQAPQALVRSVGGVGLGLPLVKRLVEMHGGSIEIRSAGTGCGTRVELRLPAVEPNSPDATPPSDHDASFEVGVGTILVIEDHEDSRASLEILLQACGYQVVCAEDGRRGVELAQGSGAHVALIDIGLPELDGYAVAREIRGSDSARSMTLIAMTGYGSPSDKQRALDAGFDAHLVKPVTLASLRAILAQS